MLFSTYAGAEHASGPKPLGSPTRESDRQAGRFGLGYALSSTYVSAVLNSSTVTLPLATSTPSSVITQPGMSIPGQASPSEAPVRARASAPANRAQSSTRHQDSPHAAAPPTLRHSKSLRFALGFFSLPATLPSLVPGMSLLPVLDCCLRSRLPLRGVTQRHCRALIYSIRMKMAWAETVDQGWGFAFSRKLLLCVENDRIILAATTRQCRQRLPIPARVPGRAPPPRVTEPTSPAGSPASRSRLPPSRCWRSTRSCCPAAPWCSCRRGTRRRRLAPRRYTGPG